MLTTSATRLRILGDFSLLANGRQVSSLLSARSRSLLTYLALRRDAPQQRRHVAALFWPETTEALARNNLRQTLHQLRQVLPDIEHLLIIDPRTLQWNPDASCNLDIADFEAALARADATPDGDSSELRAALEAANHAYSGDLLPDCFDEWLLAERERLQRRHAQALERLLRLLESAGDTRAAIPCAQRLLATDPLSEDIYRRLMRLFALRNDRASALHVYHTCVSTLQREMGVAPSAATRLVYEQILNQEQQTDSPPAPQLAAHAEPATPPGLRQPLPDAAPSLTGREREMAQLRAAWEQTNQGRPMFALITGEAGIGKSRLAEEFLRWVGEQGAVTAKARSYATEGQLSFAPVTDWLRSETLSGPLRRLSGVWLTELSRLLPELLSEQPELPRYEPMTEYGQRQRFFEAMARAILMPQQPIALALDDMQWLDQDTLAWLPLLLRFEPSARLLIVGCAREEELVGRHPLRALLLQLRSEAALSEIALEPLDAAEAMRLASQMAGRTLDMSEGLRLFHETGGYPLFVVEMMRVNPEQIAPQASQASLTPQERARNLPPRMYAVLARRLLQLSAPARTLAEQAAAIGRRFTLDLLCAIGPTDIESAARALDELWQKRIVRELSANTYDFTHDKLREVAYAELSAPQRRLLHRQVAHALETLGASDLDPVSGELASHYERAGMIEQAITAYQRAASVAQGMYAIEDAINLLLRSLELLQTQPAGVQRDHRELVLQMALGPLYRMIRGWTAPELERALDRSLALCDTVGDDMQRAQTLLGLQSVYVVQARLDRVQTVSEELRALYQRAPHGKLSPFADLMLVGARLHQGYIGGANDQFAAIIAASDPADLLQLQESQGTNYAALAMAWRAHALWLLGYPQQALTTGLEASQLVRNLNQPFNQALVSAYLALTQQLRAPLAAARASAEEAYTLTNTYQAPYYRNWAHILLTYAQAMEQPDEEHLARVEAAITTFAAQGARLRLPYYYALLAEVYARAGRAQAGLSAVERGLRDARTYHERWWDAELHRLRGELLLLRGAAASEAEAAFQRAREIAQTQEAKSLELRATLSLARLWRSAGRQDEARRQLAAIYNWFTEGFDTPDAQAAQAFLNEG